MSDCPHEIWERESDVTADGSCPICLRAEIEQLRADLTDEQKEVERANDGINWLSAEILKRDAQLTEAAAFLDRMAGQLDTPTHQNLSEVLPRHAADCRAMAKRLRGET